MRGRRSKAYSRLVRTPVTVMEEEIMPLYCTREMTSWLSKTKTEWTRKKLELYAALEHASLE